MTYIVVTKRSDDLHACMAGRPEIWGCGKTLYEAVGSLIAAHPERFNIEIKLPDFKKA